MASRSTFRRLLVACLGLVTAAGAAGCRLGSTAPPLDLADAGVSAPHVITNRQGETLLYNFRTVEPGVLYRASDFTRTLEQEKAGGTPRQPIAFQDEQTFEWLRAKNIRQVVALVPTSDFYPEEGYFRYWAERTGYVITVTPVPVAEDQVYARNDRSGLHAAAELLAIMQRRGPEDGAVLVHGEAGKDATGVAAAAYELSRTLEQPDADAVWQRVLRRYLLSNDLLADETRSGTVAVPPASCGTATAYVCAPQLEGLRDDLMFLARL